MHSVNSPHNELCSSLSQAAILFFKVQSQISQLHLESLSARNCSSTTFFWINKSKCIKEKTLV